MVDSEIEKEVEELFRYFGIGGTVQDPEFGAKQDRSLPGDDHMPRPEKWREKWDYFYKKPTWGSYRAPAEGGLVSKHHPIGEKGGFATPTHPHGHEGFDIANSEGTPIYAIGPGIVKKIYNESNNIGGNAVITSHEGGRLISYYAHLNTINVNVGDVVDQSTMIGTMGKTGNARGVSHLHWHLRLDGQKVTPNQIIGQPIGFSKNAEKSKERLTKLAQRYRLTVWQRLLLQNL